MKSFQASFLITGYKSTYHPQGKKITKNTNKNNNTMLTTKMATSLSFPATVTCCCFLPNYKFNLIPFLSAPKEYEDNQP